MEVWLFNAKTQLQPESTFDVAVFLITSANPSACLEISSASQIGRPAQKQRINLKGHTHM